MDQAERRTAWTWAFGLAAAAFFQLSSALAASFSRLHAPLKEGAGYDALAKPGEVVAAWEIWAKGAARLAPFGSFDAQTIVLWHVAAESLFVLCLVGTLAACLSQKVGTGWTARLNALRRRPWGLAVLLAGAVDLLANAGEAGIALSPSARSGIARVVGGLRVAEWILIGLAVFALLATERQTLRRILGYVFRTRAVLRVLLGLALGFVVLLYAGSIGVQSEDVVERWFEGIPWHALAALAGYLAFVFVLWTGRYLHPRKVPGSRRTLLAVGALATAAGLALMCSDRLGRGAGLFVLGVILLTVGGFENLLPETPAIEADLPGPQVRAAVAAIPAVAVGLLLVRTGANHAVAGGGTRPWVYLVAAAVSFTLAVAAWYVCRVETTGHLPRLWYVGAAVVTGVVTGVAAISLPSEVGSFGLLFLALALVTAVSLAVRSWLLSGYAPKAFRHLGFQRTPIVTLVVVWIAVASAVNGLSNAEKTADRITYYDARTVTRAYAPIGPRVTPPADACLIRLKAVAAKETVRGEFCRWVTARSASDAVREIPLVLVTASGGGVRAAAWTEKVLDCLFLRDDPAACQGSSGSMPDRWSHLFAANGASGGSVGIASTVAERLSHKGRVPATSPPWFVQQQAEDTLAPLLGHAVVKDSFLGMFGIFVGEDRAAALEDAWGERWNDRRANYCLGDGPSADQPPPVSGLGFVTLRDRCAKPVPLMLFNGTDVNSGRRVNLAPLDVDESAPTDPIAPYDLVDFVGPSQDVPLFTAAFLSARFPFVTPSGRLPTCRPPGAEHERECPPSRDVPDRVLNIVDGGYAENSGTAQVGELWAQLRSLVDAYNSGRDPRQTSTVRVVLVEIENGELSWHREPARATTVGEVFRPLAAILNVGARGRTGAREALTTGFTECKDPASPPAGAVHLRFPMYEHPGRTLPLGWTLSDLSLEGVDAQFQVKENQRAARCFAALVPPR